MMGRIAGFAFGMLSFWAPLAHAAQTNAPSTASSRVKIETVAKGLANPWGLQVLPDGRFLVTERPGRLKLISADGKTAWDISGVPKCETQRQGGLLDVALSPGFASDGLIFFSFSEPRGEAGNGTSVARAKLVLGGEGGHLENVQIIFQQQPAINSAAHFGSRLVFARDGTLFVTTGDRFSARDQAQNPGNHLGKVIHITADGAPAADNPKLASWDGKVWSIGHRNMQGAALHPQTGQLWTVEHGAMGGDELNHPEAGKNYGWPVITYGRDYNGKSIGVGTAKDGMEQPVYYWDPSIAVSGLMFYTGDMFPSWRGNALIGALNGAQLQRLVFANGVVVAQETLLGEFGERIRDVRQAPDGSVLVLTDSPQGRLLRLSPAP
ncbi:MAG: PQQ-dependent sugar dehydrogenase [Hyphomicrobium sp.]